MMKERIVSPTALRARINRKLAHQEERLCTPRGQRMWLEAGYYIKDTRLNLLVASHVDPESLARELGVLRPAEAVASWE